MAGNESDGGNQQPIQRWLVLTEFGVELEPLGSRPIVEEFFRAVRPYRRRASIVSEVEYTNAYGRRPVS